MAEKVTSRFFLAFQCEQCKNIYPKGEDMSANKEAEETFGRKNAVDDPDMAIVCDDCYNAIMQEIEREKEEGTKH